ncbi:MAG: hypothetical protein IH608_09355 [Proteobacteria bacterium]|nr:hypothetical protein [Pseudomonadota bacterium]
MRRRRYPRLTSWEEAFGEDVRGAVLPPQVHLSHPPGFEGGRLTCAISFSALDELEGRLQDLLRLVRDRRLAPLARYLV